MTVHGKNVVSAPTCLEPQNVQRLEYIALVLGIVSTALNCAVV